MNARLRLHRTQFAPVVRYPVSVAARGLCCALLWVACCVIFAAVAYGFCEPI